jgi:hypothetical protein
MPRYPKYTTTVIGAHSVPRWYETLDRLVTLGQLQPADLADAQFRAMQAAILEQEIAGIDLITGGEMHRRTHNRHSPPNAMLNHFWQKIPAFQGETRPKPITKHDPKRHSSRRNLQGRDLRQHGSGAGRRIQDGMRFRAQTGQDHDDRAALAGGGRL